MNEFDILGGYCSRCLQISCICKPGLYSVKDKETKLTSSKELLEQSHTYTDSLVLKLEAKDKEIEKLKEYASHLVSCELKCSGFLIHENKRICNCGLTELINKTNKDHE